MTRVKGQGRSLNKPFNLLNEITTEKSKETNLLKQCETYTFRTCCAHLRSAKKSVQRKAGASSTTKTATAVAESTVEKNMEAQPSNEQIALRAYFIGERRRKLGFPGDEISDRVLAEREISEE